MTSDEVVTNIKRGRFFWTSCTACQQPASYPWG